LPSTRTKKQKRGRSPFATHHFPKQSGKWCKVSAVTIFAETMTAETKKASASTQCPHGCGVFASIFSRRVQMGNVNEIQWIAFSNQNVKNKIYLIGQNLL